MKGHVEMSKGVGRREKKKDDRETNERPKAVLDMLEKIRRLKIDGTFLNSWLFKWNTKSRLLTSCFSPDKCDRFIYLNE